MAIRTIIENGDPILRKTAKEVEVVDERIKVLVEDMIETLHKYNGVGLAAPQVGILKRVIVIDTYDGSDVLVLINPKIIKTKGEQTVEEGCLSFPNQYAKVVRPKEVIVEEIKEKGEKIRVEGKELLAQALMHEIDHLNGILFVDLMIPGTMEIVEPNNQD